MRCVSLLLVVLCLSWPGAAAADDLPPPRVVDRKTGKPVGARPALAPVAPQPAPAPAPEPASPQGPQTAPAPGTASALHPAPVQATPVIEATPPVQGIPPVGSTPVFQGRQPPGCFCSGGGGDIRAQVPIHFNASYYFAADETADDDLRTKGSDTLDFQGMYGVDRRLTIGAMGRWLVTADAFSVGPLADVRVVDENAMLPQVSVGGYWLVGDNRQADRRIDLYIAASKELSFLPTNELLRGARVHAGAAYNWRTQKRYYDGWEFWLRGQLDLPQNFSVFVEAYRGCACDLSVTGGLRWRSPWCIDFTIGLFDCVGERTGYRGTLDGFPLPAGQGKRSVGGSRTLDPPGLDRGQSSSPRVENADDD